MSSKLLSIAFLLVVTVACNGSPKGDSGVSNVVENETLKVDAGPDVYTQKESQILASINTNDIKSILWEAPTGVILKNETTPLVTASSEQESTYELKVTVTHNLGKTATDTVKFIVDKTAPTVYAGNRVTKMNGPVVPNAEVIDTSPIGDYLWEKISGPGEVIFSNAHGLTPEINVTVSGQYVLKLTATDKAGNSASSELILDADVAPPVVNKINDAIVKETYQLHVIAIDDVSNALTYNWSEISGPGTLAFSNASTSDVTISADADGEYVVQVEVSDAYNNTTKEQFKFTWDTTAPEVTIKPVNTNKPVVITPEVKDLTKVTYAWSVIQKPAGGDLVLKTPNEAQTLATPSLEGIYKIQLVTTDAVSNKSTTVTTLRYDKTNPVVKLPTIQELKGPVNLLPEIVDTNPDLSYSWTSRSAEGNGTLQFDDPHSKNPSVLATENGKYLVTLKVTDGAGNVGTADGYIVWDATPPEFNLPPVLKIKVPTSLGASTPEERYEILWMSTPSGVTFTPDNKVETTVFGNDGIYKITGVLSDIANNQTKKSMELYIDTTPPVVLTKSPVITNKSVELTADIQDLTTTTKNWSLKNGPGKINFKTPEEAATLATATADGEYQVTLTVTDELGNATIKDITYIMDTVPPTVNAGPNAIVAQSFTPNAIASDNRGTLTYQWSQIEGPGTLNFANGTTLKPTITSKIDGVYIVELTATDDAGNSSKDTVQLTFDSTKPVIDVGLDEASNKPIDRTAQVTDANNDSLLWTATGPSQVIFSNPNALAVNIKALVEGRYTIKLTATDKAQNTSSDEFIYTFDKTKPVVNAGNDKVSNKNFTQSTANITDALSGIDRVIWSKETGPGEIVFKDAQANIPTILNVTKDGIYTVRVVAVDKAGNENTDTFKLTYDSTSPSVDVGADVKDKATIVKSALVTDMNKIVNQGWQKISGPGNVTFSHPTALQTSITPDKDGTYVIGFSATDIAGNVGTDTFSFIFDNDAPVIAMNQNVATNTQFKQTAQVTDANAHNGITNHWKQISGPGNCTFNPTTQLSSNPSTMINCNVDGVYVIELSATDISGHTGTKRLNLTWDKQAPVVNVPTSDVITNAPYTVNANASDNLGIKSFAWSEASGKSDLIFTPNDQATTTIQTTKNDSYIVQVAVSDKASNVTAKKFKFTFDNIKPIVMINNKDQQIYTNRPFTVSGTASDANGIASKQWTAGNNNVILNADASNDFVTVSAKNDGDYKVFLHATDNATNTAKDLIHFIWDTTPPELNNIDPVVKINSQLFNNQFTPSFTSIDQFCPAPTFNWKQTSGNSTTISNANILNPTLSFPAQGVYGFTISAEDFVPNKAQRDFKIIYDYEPPRFTDNIGGISGQGEQLQYDVEVTDNISAINELDVKVNLPDNDITATISGRTIYFHMIKPGSHNVTITVTDEAGNSVNKSLQVARNSGNKSFNAKNFVANDPLDGAPKDQKDKHKKKKGNKYLFIDVSKYDDPQGHCELIGRQINSNLEWSNVSADYLLEEFRGTFVKLNVVIDDEGFVQSVDKFRLSNTPQGFEFGCVAELSNHQDDEEDKSDELEEEDDED